MESISIEIGHDSWLLVHLRCSFKKSRIVRQIRISGLPGERAKIIAEYIDSTKLSKAKMAIVLAREISIARVIEIPAPDIDAIDGIIRFEIEKHLPVPISNICYGYRVIEKTGNIYSVLIGAGLKKKIDEISDILASVGIKPSYIFFWQDALLNSLDHFGEFKKNNKLVFLKGNSHEITMDAFSRNLPVYSKRVELNGSQDKSVHVVYKELANMAAYMSEKIENLVFNFLLDSPEAISIIPEELKSRINVLDMKGRLESSCWPAFGGALSCAGLGIGGINLLPSANRGADNYLKSAFFSGLILLLLILVGISYVAKDKITLSGLDRSLSEIKELKDSNDKNAQTNSKIAALESFSETSSTRVLNVLKELTEIMPDDTWLTFFEYKDGSVIFEGLSGNASTLLIKLDNSKLMDDFEFVSPVTRVSVGQERFRIKARFRNKNVGA